MAKIPKQQNRRNIMNTTNNVETWGDFVIKIMKILKVFKSF